MVCMRLCGWRAWLKKMVSRQVIELLTTAFQHQSRQATSTLAERLMTLGSAKQSLMQLSDALCRKPFFFNCRPPHPACLFLTVSRPWPVQIRQRRADTEESARPSSQWPRDIWSHSGTSMSTHLNPTMPSPPLLRPQPKPLSSTGHRVTYALTMVLFWVPNVSPVLLVYWE